jgi:hypothetical protein
VKPITRRSTLIATALACLVALAAAPSEDGERVRGEALRPIVRTKRVAPGLLFTRIIERQIPRRTFVLNADVSRPLTIDVTLAQNTMPARATTLQMARANDAIAAVNGDFSVRGVGRPVHAFAQDGDLVQTAGPGGAFFAMRRDETDAFIGRADLDVTVTNQDTGQTLPIDRWNRGAPDPGEIAGFSPVGGTLELPPRFACSVRLSPTGPPTLEQDAVIRDHTVDEVRCSEDAFVRDGDVVISAAPGTDEATQLLALQVGAPMRVRWSIGVENVLDVIGGMPVLVQDGHVVAEECFTSICHRNPRTAVGWTANGRVLLVVIDGRQASWSAGVTLVTLAQIMRDLGAVDAINLDGGGATTMVVRGDVVNRPSDGFQRHVTTAVLVLPGNDPGEP